MYYLMFGNGGYAEFRSKILKKVIKECDDSTCYTAVLELDGDTFKNKVYENDKPHTNMFNEVYEMPLVLIA